MWSFITSLFRKATTPPPVPSNDALMGETERDIDRIELDELPESVKRARTFLGQGLYCLGAGCKNPKAADPWTVCAKPNDPKHAKHVGAGRVFSDCSGFVDFCMGWDRNDPVYGWRYCDSIFADAKKQVRGDLGYEVPIEQVEPGDLIVYRSQDTDGDGDRDLIGHICIVSTVPATGRTWKTIRVIHCASKGPVAVRESDAQIWARRGVVFRVRQ